jgi:hypothetical protein
MLIFSLIGRHATKLHTIKLIQTITNISLKDLSTSVLFIAEHETVKLYNSQ